tara:strand:+ start:332 stop:796 length:465 start_codon:yes stop_codon:yes gene_type:complete
MNKLAEQLKKFLAKDRLYDWYSFNADCGQTDAFYDKETVDFEKLKALIDEFSESFNDSASDVSILHNRGSKVAISRYEINQYEQCSSADVSIDGVALDWDIVEEAEEVLGRVKVNGDAGRCGLILSEKTKMTSTLVGAYLYGNVVITNIARTWQ